MAEIFDLNAISVFMDLQIGLADLWDWRQPPRPGDRKCQRSIDTASQAYLYKPLPCKDHANGGERRYDKWQFPEGTNFGPAVRITTVLTVSLFRRHFAKSKVFS